MLHGKLCLHGVLFRQRRSVTLGTVVQFFTVQSQAKFSAWWLEINGLPSGTLLPLCFDGFGLGMGCAALHGRTEINNTQLLHFFPFNLPQLHCQDCLAHVSF